MPLSEKPWQLQSIHLLYKTWAGFFFFLPNCEIFVKFSENLVNFSDVMIYFVFIRVMLLKINLIEKIHLDKESEKLLIIFRLKKSLKVSVQIRE